ncbi:PorP/SprF family type IX secretion system membrane protein [Chryseolinea soli]|uniref:Type IX secretion system membrane protein PorP/SprF n=1 Tax=Chryseolinea soli TaxID=2321403 RepID=A0A385SPN8_9BACT|nr:PorP/SprF family type IX secretion system membrane protein [Chryseolinea soli]AYB32802.1 type IX secretion system membrane protein PorP/SprF [Chryseolinea soli]
MRTILLTSALLGVACMVHAQLPFQLVQNYTVPYTFNPAFSGIENYLDLKIGTRQSLAKLPDGPKSNYAGLNINLDALRNKSKLYETDDATFAGHAKKGVSLFVMQDSYGPYSGTSASAGYAYHLPLSRSLYASLGTQVMYQALRLDPNKLIPRNIDDPVYKGLLGGLSQQNNLDLNAGFSLYGEHFYVGYAYFSLAGQKLNLSTLPVTYSNIQTAQLGFNMNLSQRFQLYATGLARKQGDAYYWDASTKFRYDKEIWLGGTYRSSGSIAALLGFTFSKFFVNYSYEISTSPSILGNTHEAAIGFVLFDFLNNKVYTQRPYFL